MTTPTHLLTGASSGIGNALARQLLARGHHVVPVVRSDERAGELAAQLPDLRPPIVLDLGAPDGWPNGEVRLPDRLDSLVHCAGVVDLGPVGAFDIGVWQRQLAVNLVAPAALTARALPALRAAGGTVVFVNSGAGLIAHADWSAYAASKFGLRALADSLRAEEHPAGVRVTSVFPGRTATPMQESVHAQEGRAYDPQEWIRPETVAAQIAAVLDLPADATVPEIVIRPR